MRGRSGSRRMGPLRPQEHTPGSHSSAATGTGGRCSWASLWVSLPALPPSALASALSLGGPQACASLAPPPASAGMLHHLWLSCPAAGVTHADCLSTGRTRGGRGVAVLGSAWRRQRPAHRRAWPTGLVEWQIPKRWQKGQGASAGAGSRAAGLKSGLELTGAMVLFKDGKATGRRGRPCQPCPPEEKTVSGEMKQLGC